MMTRPIAAAGSMVGMVLWWGDHGDHLLAYVAEHADNGDTDEMFVANATAKANPEATD